MIELTPLEFSICLALTAGVFSFAAYWYIRFARVMMLDRRMRRAKSEMEDLRSFATQVLDLGVTGNASQALHEFGRRVLEALSRKSPSLQLWWVSRHEGVSGVAVARRGGCSVGMQTVRFDAALLDEAMSQEGEFDLSNGLGQSSPFFKQLADSGLRRVRIVPWGRAAASGGILAIGDAAVIDRGVVGGAAGGFGAVEPYVSIAKSHATSLAAIIDELARLSKSQEKLEGGLSSTIENLTHTHMRLIEKTRRIKALQDVAGTLSAHGAQCEPALAAIVSIVARFLEADMVAFVLLDDSTGELAVQPGSYGLEGSGMFYKVSLSEEQSSSVRAFKTGKPYMTGDAHNDPNVLAAHVQAWGVHSLIVVPLAVEGRSLGVIRVGKHGRNAFPPEALEALQVIAKEAAVIVETAMLNRKLSQAAEQLIGLNRMKDDFVSTVSHEFKTPLTSILGFITVMLEGETGELTDQQTRFLTIARGAARRLSGLVSDLLDLSRLEGGIKMELQRRALPDLLDSCAESHRHQFAEAAKSLELEVPERLPEVLCDERWITLALDNLVSNGLKFTRPGGKVRVRAFDKGEFVMVSVSDDGIGIPPEEKDRVFEKFFRASNRGEVLAPGTGLGLAIVKEIVLKHGGKIWVECEPGKETRFSFVLKTASQEAGDA